MSFKKSLIVLSLIALLLSSCNLINTIEGGNSISRLSFDKNTMNVATGQFDYITVSCAPLSEQVKLKIKFEYDENVIDLVPNNFSVVVYGKNPGTTTLKASAGGLKTSCIITVTGTDAHTVITPYVYSNTSFVSVAPNGEQQQVVASLAGGTSNDISGFFFEAENTGIVSIISEGNVAWLRGIQPGMTRVTIRHNRSSFPYTFIVSCGDSAVSFPYITTNRNIITVNKSLSNEASFSVDMMNPNSFIYDSDYTYSVLDGSKNPHNNPPISISANNKDCVITPLFSGECFIRITHKSSDVFYPLDVLVIVYEQIDNVYIEIPNPIVYVNGAAAATFTASLANIPDNMSVNTDSFIWEFPDNASAYTDYYLFGGSSFGSGDSVWISGKKTGSFLVNISHPLAVTKRSFYVVVQNVSTEAIDASTYITTTQNYVLIPLNSDPVSIGVTLYNINENDVNKLQWSAQHNPKDTSSNDPVVEYLSATGSYYSVNSGSARSASYVPTSFGELTISPSREGTAVITISHPKALYNTQILVTVLSPEALANEEKPLQISCGSNNLSLLNGDTIDVSVSLSGGNVSDENNLVWSVSDTSKLAVSNSGAYAEITAVGSGFSRNTVTVSHPKSKNSITINVVCANDDEQIASAKYITSPKYSYLIDEYQTVFISAVIKNEALGDFIQWNVDTGLNSVITVDQTNPYVLSVTGIDSGYAKISASVNGLPNTAAFFEIFVSSNRSIPSAAAYLSTSDNVVILDPYEEKTVSVTPFNLSLNSPITWSDYDQSLIELIPNNESAVIRSKGGNGATEITVSHPKSKNSITINVRVGDRFVYENTDFAYIATASDTVILSAGNSDHSISFTLVHTETSEVSFTGFSYKSSKNTVAQIVSSNNSGTVLIRPLSAGQSVLTISHPNAPDKEVLVIVERAGGSASLTPYITSQQNIVTVISGETAVISASLINEQSYNNSEWRWSVNANSSVSVVANNGSTAIIRGYNPGQAAVSVTHDKAPHPLTITVLCVDSAIAANQPWIKTNLSIMSLKTGASNTIVAEMIGGSGSDINSFRFSASNQSVIFLSQSSNSAYVRALTPGTSTVTVTNIMYPLSDPGNKKTVLVIVEPAANEDTYITLDKNTIHINPESLSSAAVNASLQGPNITSADQTNFSWWADDYSIIHLDAVSNSVSVIPTGKTGVTAIHVKHPKSPYAAEILVYVSKFTNFAFAEQSKSVPKGGTAFIPMQVPPQTGNYKIEYFSNNPSVCEIIGSNSMAMLAGIASGQTTVSASIKIDNNIVATSELAVIVGLPSQNSGAITVSNNIVNMTIGQQQTLKAALSGAGIVDIDKYNINWKSNDPDIASLIATENGTIKGPETVITAKKAGETFVTVTHEKIKYEISTLHPTSELIEECIWIIIPEQYEKIIALNQTSVIILKDDPDFQITATVLNGSQADYSQITWSAPRVSGQNIISIRGNGKTCNVHPLNIGTTTLRAQLPNGIYADCIISIQSSAYLTFSQTNLHLNPGYTEIIDYSVNPENALVQWNSVGTDMLNNKFFDFSVNEAAKKITITAKEIGTGYVQAIMMSGGNSQNNTARLNVFVEYNYSFNLKTQNVINVEPYPGTVIEIPYSVYPKDLVVELVPISAENSKFVQLYNITHDSSTGTGVIRLEALYEKSGVAVNFTARNPNDPAHASQPLRSMVVLNLVYQNITITPKYSTQSGSYSGFKQLSSSNWELILGDGEDVLFYLDVDKKNADVTNITVSYDFSEGSIHGKPYTKTENGNPGNPDGYIEFDQDSTENNNFGGGQQLWRIRHNKDIIPNIIPEDEDGGYWLITKDLFYRNLSITETVKINLISNHIGGPENFDYGTYSETYYGTDVSAKNSGFNTIGMEYIYEQPASDKTKWFEMRSIGDGDFTQANGKLLNFFDRIVRENLCTTYENNGLPRYSFSNLALIQNGLTKDQVPRIVWRYQWEAFDIFLHRYIDFYDDIDNSNPIPVRPISFNRSQLHSYSRQTGSGMGTRTETLSFNHTNTYNFTISFEDCTPYIISDREFKNNRNYYIPKVKDFNDNLQASVTTHNNTGSQRLKNKSMRLHKFAQKTYTRDQAVMSDLGAKGFIEIKYTRLGEIKPQTIVVYVQVRNCAAFSKDLWRQSGTGWIYAK